MTTKRLGWLGENFVANSIISMGMDVYLPIVDDKGVDMIVDTGRSLKRVQVKSRSTLKTSTSIEIKLKQYKKGQIDVMAIHFVPKNIIAYFPYNGEDMIHLALSTAKNNQEQGRNWFYRYMEFPL